MAKGFLNNILNDVFGGFMKNNFPGIRDNGQKIDAYKSKKDGNTILRNKANKKKGNRGKSKQNEKLKEAECFWKGLNREEKDCIIRCLRKYNIIPRYYKTAHGAIIGLYIRGTLFKLLKECYSIYLFIEKFNEDDNYYYLKVYTTSFSIYKCGDIIKSFYLSYPRILIKSESSEWIEIGKTVLDKRGIGTFMLSKKYYEILGTNKLYVKAKLGEIETNTLELSKLPTMNFIYLYSEDKTFYYQRPYCIIFRLLEFCKDMNEIVYLYTGGKIYECILVEGNGYNWIVYSIKGLDCYLIGFWDPDVGYDDDYIPAFIFNKSLSEWDYVEMDPPVYVYI